MKQKLINKLDKSQLRIVLSNLGVQKTHKMSLEKLRTIVDSFSYTDIVKGLKS